MKKNQHHAHWYLLAILLSACSGGETPQNDGSAVHLPPPGEGSPIATSPSPTPGERSPFPLTPAPAPGPVPAPTPAPNPSPPPAPTPAPTPGPVSAPSPVAPQDRLPVPAFGDSQVGAWSSVIPWSDGTDSILPIHGAILPDGRVLTYGTHAGNGLKEFLYDVWTPPTGTFASVADPLSHMTLPINVSTHIFCSAQILLPTTGDLLINGGDNWSPTNNSTDTGTNDVNLFSANTNTIQPAGTMKSPRWYATPTVMPNGEIYIQGGADGGLYFGTEPTKATTQAEIRRNDGTYQLMTGFDTIGLDNNYPRNFVAADGKIFGFDSTLMYRIDPAANGGTGSRTDFTNVNHATPWIGYGLGWGAISSAVMYRPGKILIAGGYPGSLNPEGRTSSLIDISNPDSPVVTVGPEMSYTRAWANTTVLPDGKVVVTGGTRDNILRYQADTYDQAGPFTYALEIFDPETGTWTTGPSAQRKRVYHSISMLLPNGSVLTAGGGAPGPELNMNAEIWYPHYLFNADGSWATRPTIDTAPGVIDPAQNFTLTSADAAGVDKVVMIKAASVTHAFNFEQRYIPLDFMQSGTNLQVSLPANPYETPPGFYMVFVLNQNGVPSEAKMIRITPTL